MFYSVLLGFNNKGTIRTYGEVILANNRKDAIRKVLKVARFGGFKGHCFSKIGVKV